MLGSHQYFVDESIKTADAWFVVEDVPAGDQTCTVPSGQVHFLAAESSWSNHKFLNRNALNFLRQFPSIYSCHPIPLQQARYAPPFLPWMLNANHGSIFNPHWRDINYLSAVHEVPKSKPLSMICSAQGWTDSHQLRLSFARYLKDYLGDDIDWFGNGIDEIPTKWDGLAKYERTIVLENRSDMGIYTEKILDPYLAMTQPIYWGAPDISKVLPVSKTHSINIRDFHGAAKQISGILARGISTREAVDIEIGKNSVLTVLHFLNRIGKIADNHLGKGSSLPGTHVTLMPRSAIDYESEKAQKRPFSEIIKKVVGKIQNI